MIRCAVCKEILMDADTVAIDIINTKVHLGCLDVAEKTEYFIGIKGYGLYKDILDRFI